jgi:hypothetical protein
VYAIDGQRILAGELARGPWDPEAQHGGAPAALIVRALERLPGGEELALARVTYELLRPVPLGELSLEAEVVRPGRRVQLLQASLRDAGGTEVVRARALRVRRAAVQERDLPRDLPDGEDQPPPGPEGRPPQAPPVPHSQPMFGGDAIEVRFVEGSFRQSGAGTAWFRLRVPVVEGEAPTPVQRMAAAADFPNGIASVLAWERYVFINPDLTLYIEREPVGEWIGLRARMRVQAGGIGYAEAVLFDRAGRAGRSCQALLIAPR